MGGFRVLCCSKGDRDNDDQPAHPTPSVQPVQPRPETKTQKTPENVKPDANFKSDSSSTDVPQAKQIVTQEKQNVKEEDQSVTQENQKLGPRDLWKEAYEDLDPDDKNYVPASGSSSQEAINGVIEDTKARYKEWKNGGLRIGGKNGGINIRDSAEKIINAALKASDLISTFVSFDPTGHASSAWTVISFGMSIVGNSLDRRDAIFQASDYLSEKLAYYALIDANYRNQGVGSDYNLDQTLLQVYKAILCYTVQVKKGQDENTASRAAKSMFPLTEQPLAQLKTAIAEQGAVAERWTTLASDLGNRKAAAIQLASIKSLESKFLNDEERRQVVWLSSTDHSRHHRELQDKRTGNTGTWLLDSEEYIDWKYNSGGLLWLPGNSGCGKSVLCSTIIQDIQEECESDYSKYLAYWYFKFDDSIAQNINKMTRSLIRQLSRSPMLPSVTELWKAYDMKGGEPGSKEISELFDDMVSSVPGNIYLIFDALDECPAKGDSEQREKLFEFLKNLMAQHRNKVHILATSRPEQDIKEELGPLTSSSIDLEASIAADVETFVIETMKKSKFKRFTPDIKELIRARLLSFEERRFRWADLQMAAIRDLHVDADIENALNTIPRTLEDTYMRILNGIEPANVPRARKILMTICLSPVTLSLETVAHIVGLRFAPSIIEICTTGLVSLFDGIVNVAHFSVKEFLVIPEGNSLLQHHECQFSAMDGSRFLVTTMVDFLLEQATFLRREEALSKLAFLHAARYWNLYVYGLEDSDPLHSELQPKINRLFTEPEIYFNWERVFDANSEELYGYDETEFDDQDNQPLQVASLMGFTQTVKELLDRGADINAEGENYSSALASASFMGYEGVVKLLLDAGASVSSSKSYRGALKCASTAGYENIVGIILDHIADIDAQGAEFCNSLEAAVHNGYEGIVNKLLDRATDLNGPNVWGKYMKSPPICLAANKGYDAIVRILVNRGADVNAHPSDGETSLQIAINRGDESMVRLLLDHGADVHLDASRRYNSPLLLAIYNNNERLCDMLLTAGANANASKTESSYTPLQAASAQGARGIVQLLLDHGADINADGGLSGAVALAEAARYGNFEAIKILLDRGVDVNARGHDGKTALAHASAAGSEEIVHMMLNRGVKIDWTGLDCPIVQASSRGYKRIAQMILERGVEVDLEGLNISLVKAASQGHQEIVRMLLEHGADANAHEWDRAIIRASFAGHEKTVQLLLEMGADVNQAVRDGFTALLAASNEGHQEIVRILLEHGADVNPEGPEKPLIRASLNGHERTVQLLLEGGSDVNQVDGDGRSALLAASHKGYEEIVQMLLDQGADVNLRDKEDNSALQFASENGFERVLQILLDGGAQIDCKGSMGSALQLAVIRDHEEMARILLERGADHNIQLSQRGLIQASYHGHKMIVRLLLERGADVNQVDGDGQSALLTASIQEHEDIVRMLLEQGADVNIRDEEGDSVLQYVSYRGSERIVQILLDGGAQINCKGSMGSALRIAASNGRKDIAKLLLDRGADVNVQDGELESVIQEASSNGYEEIVQLLRDRAAGLNEQD